MTECQRPSDDSQHGSPSLTSIDFTQPWISNHMPSEVEYKIT